MRYNYYNSTEDMSDEDCPVFLPPHPPPKTSNLNFRYQEIPDRNPNYKRQENNLSSTEQRPLMSSLVNGNISPQSPNARWGRSYFSQDEIDALDRAESPDNLHSADIKNGILMKGSSSRVNPRNEETKPFESQHRIESVFKLSQFEESPKPSKCQRFARFLLSVVPAILFTLVVHIVNDVMTDFQLFSASFFIFQGVFWAGLLCLGIVQCSSKARGTGKTCSQVFCDWKALLSLQALSLFASSAVVFQLLSIQYMNVSVSLALAFSPLVYSALLDYVNREARCSAELVVTSILTHLGMVVIAIPSMGYKNGKFEKDIFMGLAASAVSTLLTIPSFFLTRELRWRKTPDSLLATSFGFYGSFMSLITKEIMGAKLQLHFDQSALWAGGLAAAAFFGTVFLLLDSRFGQIQGKEGKIPDFSSFSKTRLLVFVFSCVYELIRQTYRHTMPDIFHMTGSTLVIISYLFTVAYEEWCKATTAHKSNNHDSSSSCKSFCSCIPWLCSRKS